MKQILKNINKQLSKNDFINWIKNKKSWLLNSKKQEEIEYLILQTKFAKNKKEKENYFFKTVEYLIKIFNFNFHKSYYWKIVIDIYKKEIEQYKDISDKIILKIILLTYKIRVLEEEKKNQLKIQSFLDSQNFRNNPKKSVLNNLSEIFPDFSLIIFSESDNEVLINHNFKKEDINYIKNKKINKIWKWVNFRKNQFIKYKIQELKILDDIRRYKIIISKNDWFTKNDLEIMIDPIIKRFLWLTETRKQNEKILNYKKNISEFFYLCKTEKIILKKWIEKLGSLENGWNFWLKIFFDEVKNEFNKSFKDVYGILLFFLGTIKKNKKWKNTLNDTFIKDLLKATEIYSTFLDFRKKESFLLQKFHNILLWNKRIKIFKTVRSLLLCIYEMENWKWTPLGLKPENIPLESKIFNIVRIYCILKNIVKKEKLVLDIMSMWEEKWYLNKEFFNIFKDNIEKYNINLKNFKLDKTQDLNLSISNYRKIYYKYFINELNDLLKLQNKTNKLNLQIILDNNLKTKLIDVIWKNLIEVIKKSWFTDLLLLSRHGKTLSDAKSKKWYGTPDEALSLEWVKWSVKKADKLKWLEMEYCCSPLIRTIQTTSIICSRNSNCKKLDINKIVNNPQEIQSKCIWCKIKNDDCLKNPDKLKTPKRIFSSVARFIQDAEVRPLYEFVEDILTSPKEDLLLIVSHKEIFRYFVWILNNFFSWEKFLFSKIDFNSGLIQEFYIKWWKLLKSKDFLFHYYSWEEMLKEVNKISINIFGKPFFEKKWKVNLLELENEFEDFLDNLYEFDRNNFKLFIKEMKNNKNLKLKQYIKNSRYIKL